MGYRSHVICLIYPREGEEVKVDALKVIIASRYPRVEADLVEYAAFHEDQNLLVFDFEDVKWYPNYADVQEFHQMLWDLPEMGFEYEFGRIGEDTDDIEFDRSLENTYRLQLNRSFDY